MVGVGAVGDRLKIASPALGLASAKQKFALGVEHVQHEDPRILVGVVERANHIIPDGGIEAMLRSNDNM